MPAAAPAITSCPDNFQRKRKVITLFVFKKKKNPGQKPFQSPCMHPLTADWPELSLVHYLATHWQEKWGYPFECNETLDCEGADEPTSGFY